MNSKIKTKGVALLAGLMFFLMPAISMAATFNYTPLEKFPGFANTTDLPTLVKNLYNFGIWTVGIAAMFMLVIGGFMYMTSAGNTSKAGSAKSVITDALLGLVAALGAFLLLYVINPDLTKLNFNLVTVNVQSVAPPAAPAGSVNVGCINGVECLLCNNCTSVTNICKNSSGVGCSLNADLAAKLRVGLQGQDAWVTEGWPPTVNHKSICHKNGGCADVNLKTKKGDVAAVKKVYDALKAAGLNPLYEDIQANCPKYTAVGVRCKYYDTMTYPSFHVTL